MPTLQLFDTIATKAAVTLAVKKRSAMYTICLLTILVKGLTLTAEPSAFFRILDLAPVYTTKLMTQLVMHDSLA